MKYKGLFLIAFSFFFETVRHNAFGADFRFTALSAKTSCDERDTVKNPFQFKDIKTLMVSAVKDQSASGTCWSYSAISFLESELKRAGKDTIGLSEMWIVRHAYYEKAIKYVRMHGKTNFDEGGGSTDVLDMIRKYGIVPRKEYPGLNYGTDKNKHAELISVLKAYVDAVIRNPNKALTTAWLVGLDGILDAYFGPKIKQFSYKQAPYTPLSFVAYSGIDPDAYVTLGSFLHHPYYEWFVLEIPDNWTWSPTYNIPFEEMIPTLRHAITQGFPVLWGADVSETGFQYKKGYAIVRDTEPTKPSDTDEVKWSGMSKEEKEKASMDRPGQKEKTITAEMRQKAFDNYETTDDHGMLIMGLASDRSQAIYFKVKNSWGTNQLFGGYFYASIPYVAYKTINFMVHIDGLPKNIQSELLKQRTQVPNFRRLP